MVTAEICRTVPRLVRQLGSPQYRRLARAGRLHSQRCLSTSCPVARPSKKQDDPVFNYNTSLQFAQADKEADSYRTVTALQLQNYREAPTKVKMLVRDFIDDCLYNPHYGYFSRNATIFTPPSDTGYDFSTFQDSAEFEEAVGARYAAEYSEELKVIERNVRSRSLVDKGKGKEKEVQGRQAAAEEAAQSRGGLSRQVWHTPTELFKPYYAQTLISAILQSYRLHQYPYSDLVIYEVGAGNGSFMIDSLLFLRDTAPEVFARVQYRIIEISPMLAQRQRQRAAAAGLNDKVEVINQDFLSWTGPSQPGESEQACYVVALEVFDNLSHDMIRYSLADLSPLQTYVAIDAGGDFSLLHQPVSDPLIRRYLDLRSSLPESSLTAPPVPRHLVQSSTWRKVFQELPFVPNLSSPEYIPTKALLFLEQLRRRLPAHRLMIADFDELPDAVKGRNGPVVQTRYRGRMIPCETFLVKQGYFDIFFPTNFELLRDIYGRVMTTPAPPLPSVAPEPIIRPDRKGRKSDRLAEAFFSPSTSPSGAIRAFKRRNINVYTQEGFLQQFGGKDIQAKTSTRDGTWVMGQMYRNAKIMF